MANSGRGMSGSVALLGTLVIVLAVSTVPPQAAWAQSYNRAVEFEDLGFNDPLDIGARPAGMAGALVAAGNDVHMLVYNPAGLAQIRRIELSLGLQQQRSSVDVSFYGEPNSIDTRDGGLDGVALAWPLPTYRGSLVPAFGVYRVYSSVFDLHYSGINDKTDTADNFLVQQTGSVYSYNLGFGVDLSPALSGGLSMFVLDGSVDRLGQFDFTYLDFTPSTSVFVKEDVSGGVTGVGGRVGMQFFIRRFLMGGVSFTLPTWVKVSGEGTAEITEHRDNAPDSFEIVPVSFDDSYLIPFRLDIGLAMTWKRLLLEFDFGYADWTEAAINRKRFRNPGSLTTTFREVFDYKIGAEYTLGWLPLRLRAGYAWLPYPLDGLQNDRIDENDLVKAHVDQERQRVAVGLGGLIGQTLTVDAALSFTDGSRSTDSMQDERASYRFVLGAAYRF